MGTRGLTLVKVDNEYRVAQYGQWDHYPSGQGKTVFEFVNVPGNLDKLKSAVKRCSYATDAEIEAYWKRARARDGFIPLDKAKEAAEKNPEFSRDTGAEILNWIISQPPQKFIKLEDSKSFVCDSLFCEWAYVIDFDTRTVEVFRGFNQKQLKKGDRFYDPTYKTPAWEPGWDGKKRRPYQPIRLWQTFSFDALPTVDEFLIEAEKKQTAESE